MTNTTLSPKEERTIALAALFQASQAVIDLATSGNTENFAEHSLVQSLFIFEPENTLAVYSGQLSNLQSGLNILAHMSDKKSSTDFSQLAKYALSLLSLHNQLMKQPNMLSVIQSRLKHLDFNQAHFSNDSSAVSQGLSGIYQDTISTLSFRINVTGDMQLLTQTAISDRVRAMLFAGIRAAMLWRQLGGSKWQLLFSRRDIENISKKLLEDIHTNSH